MSFRDLGLAEPLLRTVVSEGYTDPTPIQSASIPHVLAGRDVVGTAQTGTGKTAAFALPILHRLSMNKPAQPGRRPVIRALILSPTRELACQIGESIQVYGRQTGLRHTTIYGGVGEGLQTRVLRQGVDILVATPGRLLDFADRNLVDLKHVEIFVLDEADRMLDMGFLPDVKRVVRYLPQQRQMVLFSATMPDPIAALANSLLHNPARIRVAPVAATTELVQQAVCFVQTQHKPRVLTKFLKSRSIERALVFTRTKRGADRVVKDLARSGIRSDAIHGNKSQSYRQRALANFKSRHTPILIATDLAAHGIDVEGISHVLNYDLPYEPETYVHRIGRTGRAGATGVAISFCDQGERKLLKAIERLTRDTIAVDTSFTTTDDSVERQSEQVLPPVNGSHRQDLNRDDRRPVGSVHKKQATRSRETSQPHTGARVRSRSRFARRSKSASGSPRKFASNRP